MYQFANALVRGCKATINYSHSIGYPTTVDMNLYNSSNLFGTDNVHLKISEHISIQMKAISYIVPSITHANS